MLTNTYFHHIGREEPIVRQRIFFEGESEKGQNREAGHARNGADFPDLRHGHTSEMGHNAPLVPFSLDLRIKWLCDGVPKVPKFKHYVVI